jgi:thermitase
MTIEERSKSVNYQDGLSLIRGDRRMCKKTVSGIFLTLCIAGLLLVAFKIEPVKASGTIYIRADGSVDPPTAPISTIDNVSYTFADNIISDSHGAHVQTMKSFFENGLNARLMYDPQTPFEEGGTWGFDNKAKRIDSASGDEDSAELVVGLSNVRPNSHSELVGLVESDGGKLANTVSMGRKVTAVVVDMPYETLPSFASKVRAMDLARYVEPNVKFKIDSMLNDPDWPKQWGPQKIEADWAWNTTAGDPSVLVAVVDTGIDWNHPDLARNYVPLGYDWVNNDPDPMDDNGHGTHCAGVIAAIVNNSIGMSGLAQVRVMAEKGLDESGSGSSSDLANAIVHAVDQGVNIISCSWGDPVDSTLLHEAIKYAHDHDVLVVAAAGNDAANSRHYPAAYDEVVAVTATDQNDDPAGFTNFGDWVEVAAPGVQIYSTMPSYWVTLNSLGYSTDYGYLSGTSMSTPHVSGVAALVWSRFPNMIQDQVRAQLRNTAEDFAPQALMSITDMEGSMREELLSEPQRNTMFSS